MKNTDKQNEKIPQQMYQEQRAMMSYFIATINAAISDFGLHEIRPSRALKPVSYAILFHLIHI